MARKFIFTFLFLTGVICTCAQTRDSLNLKPENSALAFDDSLSIFNLIDSLVRFPGLFEAGSSLVARLGYNSNVNSTNQSLGLSQFGLSPGVSYYHKSGFYLDATAYWSQEYAPSLYLTVGSAGYLKTIKKWTLNLEYSRYFYTLSDSTYYSPYTNVLALSNFLEVRPLLFRLDYSLYFGEKTAHRIMPTVMLNLEKTNWLGFKRVLLYPSFSVLLGNESWQNIYYIPYSTRLLDLTFRLRNHLPLSRQAIENNNEFGILNYSVSMPLSVSLKNWTFLLSYTYNFPQPLSGEQLGLTRSGYLSFSLIRYINFKSHSSLIDFYKLSK
ncbi:MAG TPA: hypothetical protein VKQ08_08605 [Cyclobacteriaceae bacterium]|nr:hypothetical protein [Cyclobacteriaceae bacterium]